MRKNGIIQGGSNVHPSSSLGAIYIDSTYGWRVYYQETDGDIGELVGNNGWSAGTLGGTGIAGSPIAVALLSGPIINVYYVEGSVGCNCLYILSWNGGWASSKIIRFNKQSSLTSRIGQLPTTAFVSSWSPNQVSLAATSQTQPYNNFRTYFIGRDKEVWEFGLNDKQEWNPDPAQSPVWADCDYAAGGITAIGWDDQIRFYYVVGGEVVQAALSGTSWSESGVE